MELPYTTLKHGDKRIYTAFALFPTIVEGKKIWLERFMVEEEWIEIPECDLHCWTTTRRWRINKD